MVSIKGYYYWELETPNRMDMYLHNRDSSFVYRYTKKILSKEAFILDIGGGGGRFSIPLSRKGFKLVVLEYSKIPLRKLKEKDESISIVQADGQILPFKKDCFDAVLLIEVLSYLKNGKDFFFDCNKILKKGGVLYMVTSNSFSFKGLIRRISGKSDKFYRYSYFDLVDMLNKNNFEVNVKVGFNWVPFSRGSDSHFIPFFSFLEKIFLLSKLYFISPWVFIVAKKKGVDK